MINNDVHMLSSNDISNISISNSEIKNKGFVILDSIFKSHGWHLIRNEMNHICYGKIGHETEYFEIKITETKIYVSLPVKNSIYLYKTSFTEYFLASEYIEKHFLEHIGIKKIDFQNSNL